MILMQFEFSLASPEQIRSWSYGEVTKPETINYRTLKPEETVFSAKEFLVLPKITNVSAVNTRRYVLRALSAINAVVEVARFQVRRERMGHIELASSGQSYWFAKGIPSRLGLYSTWRREIWNAFYTYFSHYIITSVDENAKQELIAKLEKNTVQEATDRQTTLEAKVETMAEAPSKRLIRCAATWLTE